MAVDIHVEFKDVYIYYNKGEDKGRGMETYSACSWCPSGHMWENYAMLYRRKNTCHSE